MNKDEIIELAHHAGIVFRLGNEDVTPEKLEQFLALAQRCTRGERAKAIECMCGLCKLECL